VNSRIPPCDSLQDLDTVKVSQLGIEVEYCDQKLLAQEALTDDYLVLDTENYETRIELEQEITLLKQNLSAVTSDSKTSNPSNKRQWIQAKKKLLSLLPLRYSMPSQKDLEMKIEEIDFKLQLCKNPDEKLESELAKYRGLLKKEVAASQRFLELTNASQKVAKTNKDNLDGVLTIFQSAPLSYVNPETHRQHFFPLLDFAHEVQVLKKAMKDARRIGKRVRVETEIATVDRLSAFFAQGGRKILHLSCHGHPDYLVLETGFGSAHPLPVKDLKRFLSPANLDLVFVSACHSRSAGEAFLQAGVKHVVCCRQDTATFRDEAAAEFARHFYRALACQKTLKEAFSLSKASVSISPLVPNGKEESDKFLLLPEACDETYHDINISFTDERSCSSEADDVTDEMVRNLTCKQVVNRIPAKVIAREKDVYRILDALRCTNWLHVHASQGTGKTTVVATAIEYITQRSASFMHDRIIWIQGPVDVKDWKQCVLQTTPTVSQPLVIVDLRTRTSDHLHLAQEILTNFSRCKMITIDHDDSIFSRLEKYCSLPARAIHIDRLNHFNSVCLFSCLVFSARFAPQLLASILSFGHPSSNYSTDRERSIIISDHHSKDTILDAILHYRQEKLYQQIGAGNPRRILQVAATTTDAELSDWITRLRRGTETTDNNHTLGVLTKPPTTRAQLEEYIRSILAKEAKALREEDYAKARGLRDCLEELQHLRSLFSTPSELKRELSELQQRLQDAICERNYVHAEDLRIRRERLKRQLKREEENQGSEHRFQHVRRHARKAPASKAVLTSSVSSSGKNITRVEI